MKRLSLILLILATFITPNVSAQSSLRISPTATKLTAQPGSTQRVIISLQNPTNKPVTVKVFPRDFESSPEQNGEPQLLASNTSPYSLANWHSDSNLNKQVTVPANQTIDYEAVFRVPFGLSPKTYFGSVSFMQESNILVSHPVFITVGNPETKFIIEELTYSESDDATKPNGVFSAVITNISDALITPTFILKITDESGTVNSTIEAKDEGLVLPASKRRYTFTPTDKLALTYLTATLTATDQNGITSDKSLQIDRKPVESAQTKQEQINPNDFAWIPIVTVVCGLAVISALYFRLRKRPQSKNTPD